MSNTELMAKIKEYREYARMIEEMEALKDSIADELKTIMTEAEQEKMIVGEYKLSYTNCSRKDIDKKALQAEHADIYNAFLKEITYKRFSIA